VHKKTTKKQSKLFLKTRAGKTLAETIIIYKPCKIIKKMKKLNLDAYNVSEMSNAEMRETDGGLRIAGAAFLAGLFYDAAKEALGIIGSAAKEVLQAMCAKTKQLAMHL